MCLIVPISFYAIDAREILAAAWWFWPRCLFYHLSSIEPKVLIRLRLLANMTDLLISSDMPCRWSTPVIRRAQALPSTRNEGRKQNLSDEQNQSLDATAGSQRKILLKKRKWCISDKFVKEIRHSENVFDKKRYTSVVARVDM